MKKTILLSAILSSSILAESINLNKSESTTLTIYNNLTLVNELKSFNIKDKDNLIIYNNVPRSIIFESIQPAFSKKTNLFSQNFKLDTLTLNKLLEKNLGKTIRYKIFTDDYEYITKKGILLSINPILLKTNIGIETSIQKQHIIFDEIPKDLILKPSLVWKTQNTPGNQNINLNYLTNNISWKADYNLLLKNDTASLNSWVTINNNSGSSFKNTNINIVAGKINTQRKRNYQKSLRAESIMSDGMSFNSPAIKQEAFSGLYFYKIPFKEDILNKQSTQINFISKDNIIYKESAILNYSLPLYKFDKPQKRKFKKEISFKNEKENNLGIALPLGTIRVYQEKTDKNIFIGQNNLNNTPNNKTVTINTGEYFDLTSELKQTKHLSKRNYKRLAFINKLQNSSKKNKDIILKEFIREGNNVNLTHNCYDICSFSKENNSYTFKINLKKDSYFNLKTDYEIFK